jgi:hypothetical protein
MFLARDQRAYVDVVPSNQSTRQNYLAAATPVGENQLSWRVPLFGLQKDALSGVAAVRGKR